MTQTSGAQNGDVFQPQGGREALPKPCLGCGAPMVATGGAGLREDASLKCRFCGKSETMPADAAAQDRLLRLRLMQLRRSREALEAPLKTFEMVRQSWTFGLVIFATMGGWQLWQALSAAGKAPLESSLFGAFGGAAVVGVVFGYIGMSRAFRALVKPLLQAKPPMQKGLFARCRCCGGDLPQVRTAQVQCGFCGANNFLDAAQAKDVSNLLAAEQAEYQRRATSGQPADGSAYQMPAKAFYRWMGIGAGATFVVVAALLLLL